MELTYFDASKLAISTSPARLSMCLQLTINVFFQRGHSLGHDCILCLRLVDMHEIE